MNEKYFKVKEKLSDALELPKDITMDISRMVILGREDIVIENHKGIIDYSEERISINTGIGTIVINGNHLIIKSIVQEEIVLKGNIVSISF